MTIAANYLTPVTATGTWQTVTTTGEAWIDCNQDWQWSITPATDSPVLASIAKSNSGSLDMQGFNVIAGQFLRVKAPTNAEFKIVATAPLI